MTALFQLLANVAQAAIEPFLLRHRVTCGLWSDNLTQDGYEGGIFFRRDDDHRQGVVVVWEAGQQGQQRVHGVRVGWFWDQGQ